VSCAKSAEPIKMPFGMWIREGPRNHVLDGVQIPTHEETILRAKMSLSGHSPDMSGGRYIQSDSTGAEPERCGCRLVCPRCGAHWRHLASTTEPAVAVRPYVKLP